MSIRQHDFTIERRYRQSPEQTFQAFADPDLRQRWFRVPDSWTDSEWSMEFRVGGAECNAGRDDRGQHHRYQSRFHDIVAPERIVFSSDMLLDGRLTSVSLTTIELRRDDDDDGGTRLIFTEHGAFLDGLEDPAEREHGTNLLFDGLDTALAGEVTA